MSFTVSKISSVNSAVLHDKGFGLILVKNFLYVQKKRFGFSGVKTTRKQWRNDENIHASK